MPIQTGWLKALTQCSNAARSWFHIFTCEITDRHGSTCQIWWIFFTCKPHIFSVWTVTLTYCMCMNSQCNVSGRSRCPLVPDKELFFKTEEGVWLSHSHHHGRVLCQQGTKWKWKLSSNEKGVTQERGDILGISIIFSKVYLPFFFPLNVFFLMYPWGLVQLFCARQVGQLTMLALGGQLIGYGVQVKSRALQKVDMAKPKCHTWLKSL